MTKRTFLVRRRNTSSFKYLKDLNVNRFLDMHKYCHAELFKKVVECMKEEGCVFTVEKILMQRSIMAQAAPAVPVIT